MSTTNTCADQVPINNTVQATVGPGDQTGVYYILVSNLPWNTAWQGLKDHMRQACAVDKVEVFNQSTSGWIRLKGRDNFDKAMNFVRSQQGHLNGRAILASGRNATESVVIRTRIVASPPLNASAALRGTAPGNSMVSPTTTAAVAGSWANPATQAYYHSTMPSPTHYGYQEAAQPSWYPTATAQGGYAVQSPTVATSTYQYQSGYGSNSQYPQQYAQQQPYSQSQGYDQSGYYSSALDQTGYQQSDYYSPGYDVVASEAAQAPAEPQSSSDKKSRSVVVAHGSWGAGGGGGGSSSG